MQLSPNIYRLTCLASGENFDSLSFAKRIALKKEMLLDNNVRAGHLIALLNNNTADFLAMLLAIWQIDAGAFPLDKTVVEFNFEEFARKYSLDCVYDGIQIRKLNSVRRNEEKGVQLILLSSGTTGESKGIGFSTSQVFSRISAINERYGAEFNKTLCVLPTSFGHGLVANTLAPLMAGNHVFLSPKFDVNIAMNLGTTIDENEITSFSSVPALWNLLRALKSMQPKKNSLKQVHCASEFLQANTYSFARNWIHNSHFHIHYGLTECASWVTGGELPVNPSEFEFGFVGTPLRCDFEIKKKENEEEGLIYLNCESIPENYIGADAFPVKVKNNGFLMTGDVGYLSNGSIYLSGRISDFINQGGEKISAKEAESAALKYPAVTQAAAIAIPHHILGEQMALVVSADASQEISLQGLKDFLELHLAPRKRPKLIFVFDKIPLTINQKINKLQLKTEIIKNLNLKPSST